MYFYSFNSSFVVRTNKQIQKIHEKVDADKFSFRCSDTNEVGLLIFKGLYQDTNQPLSIMV